MNLIILPRSMSHEHCRKCFLADCSDISSCPVIRCPDGCFARMHECKVVDHKNLCPNVFAPCLNVSYGCPSIVRRCQISQHLRQCPASITVCSFTYHHEYHTNTSEQTSPHRTLLQTIAVRDNLWSQHVSEFEDKQKEIAAQLKQNKHPVERVIRSGKYRYITMPECMLSRGNGEVCSTCRKYLRQLEENEDQRLSELNEEEQKIMANFNLHYDHSSDQPSIPSLVKMSSTPINSTSNALLPSTMPTVSTVKESSPNHPLPVVSDTEFPSSFVYRLKYFASNSNVETIKSFTKSPRFPCNALCRRDELEQHWLVHLQIDCILNTSLIESCPKYQYGCSFEYERLEPCRIDGQAIQIRFDELNDAIAFEWHSTNHDEERSEKLSLLDLPPEILEKIFLRLDSLSLRNTSLVCHHFRALCQSLLPSRGIVMPAYERTSRVHGGVTWVERKQHWFFTNTSSAVPKWQLKTPNPSTSLNQHMINCSYGETKDLQSEPPFALHAWAEHRVVHKPVN